MAGRSRGRVVRDLPQLALELPFAVLVGAGISLDPPSNLLDGASFLRKVLLRAAPPNLISWVERGLERPQQRISRPDEFLRFEHAMQALSTSGLDSEIRVLDCLGECRSPNRNH